MASGSGRRTTLVKGTRGRSTRAVSSSDSDSDTLERRYYDNTSEDSEDNDDDLLPKVKGLKLAENRDMGSGPQRTPKPVSVVTNVTQLSPLGRIRALTPTDGSYGVIAKYAMNSAGAGLHLRVRNIYGIASGIPTAQTRQVPAPAQVHQQPPILLAPQASAHSSFLSASQAPPSFPPALGMGVRTRPIKKVQLDMLLWTKTSPTTAKFLAQRGKTWVAFYDRIERAFPGPPDEWEKGSSNQIILLCSVSMGKPFKSEDGYHHWRSQQLPQGFDSVLARGRVQPDWEDSREVNSVLVPCGKTMAERSRRKLPLSHTEYLVNHNNVKPMYAVEVQIIPNGRSHR